MIGPGMRVGWLPGVNSVDREKPDFARRTAEGGCPHIEPLYNLSYAVRLGLIVKSRTWVRMLDICIPFSCETKGRISAMN